MNEQHPDSAAEESLSVNPGYVVGQLAKALQTSQSHPDATTRQRAERKIDQWIQVFKGMVSGALTIGSRTPVQSTPGWVTLEVARGGFATGALVAEGALQRHEIAQLQTLGVTETHKARAILNNYYLSDQGFATLQTWLHNGQYRINIPEEGALLTVAWLVDQGLLDQAHALLQVLGPFLGRLRFYPVPAEHAMTISATVFRQPVAQTLEDVRQVKLRRSSAREREDLLIWAPLYDQVIALFAETVVGDLPFVPLQADGQPQRRPNQHYAIAGGWPCQHYPDGWAKRAQAVLDNYQQQRSQHTRSARPERPTESFAILRAALTRCIQAPQDLTGREVGLVRSLLAAFAFSRGMPGSPRHQELRQKQQRIAHMPTNVDVANVLVQRLQAFPEDEGLPHLDAIVAPLTFAEAEAFHLPEGLAVPPALQHKVARSLAAPAEVLIERKIIPSSEALAEIIPQLSANTHVAALADPRLQQLSYQLYTAFRRRRSLLLLNLQHQVTFSELPWVKAIESHRTQNDQAKTLAYDVLRQVVTLALSAFPQSILPNTLLREIEALAASAAIKIPIVDEIAADIFMGTFSEKYLRAAQSAGKLLTGSLYERYYGLDYVKLSQIDDVTKSRFGTHTSDQFIQLCKKLAGADKHTGRWSVATNGTIIEQEQILTTHNLAVLFDALELRNGLNERLDALPRQCFASICAELHIKRTPWKAQLRTLKNSAYAWRQMIFFLSQLSNTQVQMFLAWADEHLTSQPIAFQERFRPALVGLVQVASGATITLPARRFLGWSVGRHWLMETSASDPTR